ncbi:MAG: ribonuclease HII [Alphaproteobacteria bacterium]|nr:MAG: ribonuclease HII [Alphaproteobacteria bacterium]
MPSFAYEKSMGTSLVAGIDEVGCGPWAGPVVAAAVIILYDFPKNILCVLRDSKKLSAPRRRAIFSQLCHENGRTVHIGVGEISAATIDAITIAGATKQAMKEAIDDLSVPPSALIIDGNRDPLLPFPTQMIVKGDQISYSIAAASIVAKVVRDTIMAHLDTLYSGYGWLTNVGYGTQAHLNALIRQGITPFHRQSYAPIQKICARDGSCIPSHSKTFYDGIYNKSISKINKIICT